MAIRRLEVFMAVSQCIDVCIEACKVLEYVERDSSTVLLYFHYLRS